MSRTGYVYYVRLKGQPHLRHTLLKIWVVSKRRRKATLLRVAHASCSSPHGQQFPLTMWGVWVTYFGSHDT